MYKLVVKGADTITNLRPICGNCNRSMGNNNMVDFQKNTWVTQKKILIGIGQKDLWDFNFIL